MNTIAEAIIEKSSMHTIDRALIIQMIHRKRIKRGDTEMHVSEADITALKEEFQKKLNLQTL